MEPQPQQQPALLSFKVREFPRTKGWIAIQKNTFHDANQRGETIDCVLMEFIAERTRSAPLPRPEYARIDMEEFVMLVHKSERTILAVLQRLERRGWIVRQFPKNKTCRGGFKLQPQNIRNTPLFEARVCAPRNRPKTVAVLASYDNAAMRHAPVESIGHSQTPQDTAECYTVQEAAIGAFQQAAAEESARLPDAHPAIPDGVAIVPNSAAETQNHRSRLAGFPQPTSGDSAVCCPLGLCCPYKVKDLGTIQTEEKTEASIFSNSVSQSVGTNRPTEVRMAIPQDLFTQFGYPRPELLQRIVSAMPTAPVERLTAKIEQRRKAFAGPRGSLGLVLNLATEVEGDWCRAAAERERQRTAVELQQRVQLEEAVQWGREEAQVKDAVDQRLASMPAEKLEPLIAEKIMELRPHFRVPPPEAVLRRNAEEMIRAEMEREERARLKHNP